MNAVQLTTMAFSGLAIAISVWAVLSITQRVRMQQTQLTTSAQWPPPYAVNKGVKQDLAIEGFAFTYGNGCAFVHMRPVLHFGPGCDRKALYELKSRLELAHGRVCARLGTITELHGASIRDEAREAVAEFNNALDVLDAPPATRERAMSVLRDTIRGKAATQGERLCEKHDPESLLPCIDDYGHEGECTFPRFQQVEPAPVPEGKKS